MKSGDLHKIKLALEAIKKICKKYRFMFRSDALYTEMNYMIENLSELLVANLMTAVNGLSAQTSKGVDEVSTNETRLLLSTVNSTFHIIESILSQEELPDFYEDNLETITQACIFMLDTDYPQIQSAKDREILFRARAKVVRLAHLYQFKFSEHFEKYANIFFEKIWN
jgi:hypothetical protein